MGLKSMAVAMVTVAAVGGGAWVAMAPDASSDFTSATPEDLVHGWIDAIGGMEAYWPMRSGRWTLTTEMYEPETGRLRRARPRYVTVVRGEGTDLTRIERWEGNDFIVQGWNGEEAWATRNGEFLEPGDMDYDQVLYVSGDVNYWIGLPYKLRDPGVQLHDRGTDDQGRRVVGVTFGDGVGLHDGDTWQYWFVDGNTWPVQLAYREEGRENFSVLRFEDIRSVDGYVFVGQRVHTNADGHVWKILRTHDFELNPEIDRRLFDRP